MPYAGAPPGPNPYPQPAGKKRPSGWWFAVGGVLLLLATVSAGIAAGMVVHFFASADMSIPMRGAHRVHLPAHTERMTFSDGSTESCVARTPDGSPIFFQPLGGASDTERHASDFARFDTGDGTVVFLCFGSTTDSLWITGVPHGGSVVRLIVLGAAVPLLVGGTGFVVLLVTSILWITRRPRPTPYAGPPPGYYPGPG
jgi:hypothetical protein